MSFVKQSFPVLNMSCASCAANVQRNLNQFAGVQEASVNIADKIAQITYDPDVVTPLELQKFVQSIGYHLIIDDTDNIQEQLNLEHKKELKKLKINTLGAIIPSALLMGTMFLGHNEYMNYIMWALATPVVFIFGRDFYIRAWKQLKHGSANMDTLVALSTGCAYLFSVFNTLFSEFWTSKGLTPHVYFEASAVVIAFILLGKLLEERAKSNTSTAIQKLIGLQPKTVTIELPNKEQKEVFISQVKEGDILIVKPGEKIAVDGIIVSGSSFIDESSISGEPIPVEKSIDDAIFAGTLNQQSSFKFKAEKVGSETLLAQIIKMVQNAQASKAPVQKLTDKIASIFVPIVIAIAIITLIIWLLSGVENAFTHGLMAMITVLVIACPCALGLATPTAVMVGIGKGAENGILIKNASALELAKNINALILDKTGTITEGKPKVSDVFWLHNNASFLPIFVGMEKLSDHPLANAIEQHFTNIQTTSNIAIENIAGKGLSTTIEGVTYYAGSKKFMQENNLIISNEFMQISNNLSKEAKSLVWFGNNTEVLAIVGITDHIKPTSIKAIEDLKQMNIDVYMLTGDNLATAESIAKQTGINNYKAETSPIDKTEFVKKLQSENKIVAMVGDGINDSSALAQANVSIAMGKGSDIAIDVADITIISSDLEKISQAIKLSKHTVNTIKQNLFWAFIYNLIGIPIAAGILFPINGFLLNPMIAGAAMALSSVSVVSNSLRLKRKKI